MLHRCDCGVRKPNRSASCSISPTSKDSSSGGSFVFVDGSRHELRAGQAIPSQMGSNALQVGLEIGDQLNDGIPDCSEAFNALGQSDRRHFQPVVGVLPDELNLVLRSQEQATADELAVQRVDLLCGHVNRVRPGLHHPNLREHFICLNIKPIGPIGDDQPALLWFNLVVQAEHAVQLIVRDPMRLVLDPFRHDWLLAKSRASHHQRADKHAEAQSVHCKTEHGCNFRRLAALCKP